MTAPLSSFQGLASNIQWRDLVDQIIELETSRALGPISRNLLAANARVEGWGALGAVVSKVRDSLKALQDGTAFRTRSATVGTTGTGRSLGAISNFGTAAPGRYQVEVQNLAQSEKLTGTAVADPTADLVVSGRISINGVAVTIETGDSLNRVRDKINAANTGSAASRVSASIVGNGSSSRLVLNADATGANGIELADDRSGTGGTSTLEALGFIDSTRRLNTGTDGRVRSTRVSSTTLAAAAALGVNTATTPATILVNGRSIAIDLETDSITDIVARINALSVNAAKVETETDGGTTWSRIAIAGSVVGDGSTAANTLLETLGMRVGGRTSAVRQVLTTGTALTGFGGATATGATLLADLGAGSSAGMQAGDVITLSGTDGAGAAATLSYTVSGTDTVDDLIGAIESAFSGGRAVDVSIVNGQLTFADSVTGESRLDVTLSAGLQGGGTLDFGANTTQFGRVRQLSAGEDARIVVDGALFVGRTNTIAGAVGGGTLTISGEEPGSTFDVTVSATPETSVDGVQSFATAYNELLAAVAKETKAGGRLANASSARAILGALKGSLLNDMQGLGDGARYNRAGSVGLELQRDGTLKLDADKFRAALASDARGVEALFGTGGSSSNGNVQFVGSDGVSPAGVYALAVTQAATRSAATGSVMSPYVIGGTPATMTVTGEGSGRSATITFASGDTPAILAARLQAALGEQSVGVSASVVGGALRLTSDAYGSPGGFTVSYGDPGGEDPAAQLGIAAAVFDNGIDAAGTLNGVALTGSGQLLTAVNGIVLRYTGLDASATSTVRFARGLAGSLSRSADLVLNAGTGTIALQQTSAQTGIASLERREVDVQARLDRRRESLVAQFVRMESLLSRLQSQGQYLTSQIGAINASNGN
ncbi:MAG: flagellar filament capping protein FliD [Gemmatimonadetes bacterium]|nr:flagellar filament capping protein FliD [Gemmatimonadota bacterium]